MPRAQLLRLLQLCIERGICTIAEGYQLPISFTLKDGKSDKCDCSILVSIGVTTQEEHQDLLQKMQVEMYSDDFGAVMFLLTAWGNKPQDAS